MSLHYSCTPFPRLVLHVLNRQPVTSYTMNPTQLQVQVNYSATWNVIAREYNVTKLLKSSYVLPESTNASASSSVTENTHAAGLTGGKCSYCFILDVQVSFPQILRSRSK